MEGSVRHALDDVLKKATLESEKEEDFYKVALLLRIKSTVESIRILYDNNSYLNTPVITRVAFEHACRLFQYDREPNSITKGFPTAYKLLGRSPGVKYTISKLGGDDLYNIYSMLSAFTHADLTSLVLSLSGNDGTESLISVIIELSFIVILHILLKVYPEQEVTEEELANRILVTFNTMLLNISTALTTSSHLNEISELFSKYDLFANSKANDIASAFFSQAIDDPEQSMDFLIKQVKLGMDSQV